MPAACHSARYCFPQHKLRKTSVTDDADAELAGEGDYRNVHWEVSSNGLLTIVPKDGLATAAIEDFYEVTENPDPYAQDHEVTTISPTPWSNCSITDVVIADGITFVGGYAFYQNTGIQTVYLADSVKAIGTHAFTDTNVSEVHFSENLISIGEAAFQNTDLTDVERCIRYEDAYCYNQERFCKYFQWILPNSEIIFFIRLCTTKK